MAHREQVQLEPEESDELLSIAGKIPNLNQDKFEREQVRPFTQSSSNDTENSHSDDTSDAVKDPDRLHFADIRGQRARPGSLDQEKLKDQPREEDEFEITNPDRISLRTYKKMAHDPVLSLGMRIIKSWIGSLQYNIQSDDNKIEEVIDYSLNDIWMPLTRGLLGNALKFGFSVGEKKWTRDKVILDTKKGGNTQKVYEGKLLSLDNISFVDPETLDYYKEGNEISRVEQRQSGKTVSVDAKKLTWFSLDRQEYGVFGLSRLKAAYVPWHYGKVNFQQALSHIERTGSPLLKGRYPKGQKVRTEDGRVLDADEVLLKILQKANERGIAVLSSEANDNGEYKWDINYAEVDGDIDPYKDWEQQLNEKKMYSLGLPGMFAGGESNFSEMDALIDVFMVILEGIVDQLEYTVREDIVYPLVDLNFGKKFRGKIDFSLNRSMLNRKRTFKEVLNNTLRSAFSQKNKKPSVIPDIDSMSGELGIPTVGYDQAMSDDPNAGPEGMSPQAEDEDDRKSNDENRVQDRQTDEDRDSQRDDATD